MKLSCLFISIICWAFITMLVFVYIVTLTSWDVLENFNKIAFATLFAFYDNFSVFMWFITLSSLSKSLKTHLCLSPIFPIPRLTAVVHHGEHIDCGCSLFVNNGKWKMGQDIATIASLSKSLKTHLCLSPILFLCI